MVSVMPPNLGGFFSNSIYPGLSRGQTNPIMSMGAAQYWPQEDKLAYASASVVQPRARSNSMKHHISAADKVKDRQVSSAVQYMGPNAHHPVNPNPMAHSTSHRYPSSSSSSHPKSTVRVQNSEAVTDIGLRSMVSQFYKQRYDMSQGSGGPPKVRSLPEKLHSSVMSSEAVIAKCAPLFVDCSVEYELPKIPKIPSDSQPLLKVCPGYEKPTVTASANLHLSRFKVPRQPTKSATLTPPAAPQDILAAPSMMGSKTLASDCQQCIMASISRKRRSMESASCQDLSSAIYMNKRARMAPQPIPQMWNQFTPMQSQLRMPHNSGAVAAPPCYFPPSPLTPSEDYHLFGGAKEQIYFPQQTATTMWPSFPPQAQGSWLSRGPSSAGYPFMMSTPYPSPYMTPLGMAPMNTTAPTANNNNSAPCCCTACQGIPASKVAPVMRTGYPPVTKDYLIHSGRYRSV
eukprot:maker-scaffold1606_size34009-snap-gene-0.4 protein:Tk10091 transcript:maker-scaffold1606_size34009-snap-gene-0.4-mRNA-1 annotation:"hypothetical protein DAPPUDRAFT_99210"